MRERTKDHAEAGNAYVNDTSAHSVEFYGFTVVSDAVISAITVSSTDADVTSSGDHDNIVGDTLPEGLYLPISGSSITLSSGAILLHKKYN
jgi:hypothetical protein